MKRVFVYISNDVPLAIDIIPKTNLNSVFNAYSFIRNFQNISCYLLNICSINFILYTSVNIKWLGTFYYLFQSENGTYIISLCESL